MMSGAFIILALLLRLGDKTLWPFAAGLSSYLLRDQFWHLSYTQFSNELLLFEKKSAVVATAAYRIGMLFQ